MGNIKTGVRYKVISGGYSCPHITPRFTAANFRKIHDVVRGNKIIIRTMAFRKLLQSGHASTNTDDKREENQESDAISEFAQELRDHSQPQRHPSTRSLGLVYPSEGHSRQLSAADHPSDDVAT